MTVSIIVPVYNAERFLRQCIESILGQTCQNLRLILVDDGSTDSSGIVCDDYARQDHRVTVIHQKNAGPASARNSALAILDPDGYVMFVDADDYLAPNALERCLHAYGNIPNQLGDL
jgi:glycosyltransferase involved in cell wall biosynthesis